MSEHKRTNDPQAVRRRIVDAAYQAFVTQGYLATGMSELRAKASVSGGAMAHHFPAKRELGLAVIRDRVAVAVRQTWIEPLHASSDTPAAIDQIFTEIINELSENGSVSGCPLNNMAIEVSKHDDEMQEALGAIFDAWEKALAARFHEDIRLKRVADIQPNSLATLIIAAYSGAMAMAKASQDTRPLVNCQAELAALLASKYA
ncbi:TetR/AcrR family transcriptional regulator [Ensifer sp. KUDG1]|uniref:TetR/AcrR family transcriptional regulator n=1 Tax=Ensifer sp. KUDG1 TaxID=3373919 RepID=UPI003D2110A3